MKIFQTKNGARKMIKEYVVLLLHALVSKRAKQFILDREELFGQGEFYSTLNLLCLSRTKSIALRFSN